jgi:ATP-dependent RNA helicase DeaD
LRNPEHVSVIPKQVSAPLIQQNYIEVQEKQKFDALSRLLDMESPELAIVFGRTKRRVDELAEALQKCGYAADGLHGDLSQHQRDTVMRKFRENSIEVLVATDVAARGLDVSGVSHVINFDLPQDPESYVHRIGRTGRAGREGTSWTFVTPREIDHLYFIEKITRHKITRKPLPSLAEALEGKQKMLAEKLLEIVDAKEFGEYKAMAIQLLEQYDSVQLLSAAIKMLTGEKNEVSIELTPEEPVRVKKRFHDSRGGGGQRRFSGAPGNHSSHVNRGPRRDRSHDRGAERGGERGSNDRYSRDSARDGARKPYGDRSFKRDRALTKKD